MSSSTETQTATEIHLSKDEFDDLPDLAKNAITASGIPLSVTATVPAGTEARKFSVLTATVDKDQSLAACSIVGCLRWDWGKLTAGEWILNLSWSVVTAASLVFVAVGEGVPGGGKIIGSARITLYNVAPRNGGVTIWVGVGPGTTPIDVSADYLVVNP